MDKILGIEREKRKYPRTVSRQLFILRSLVEEKRPERDRKGTEKLHPVSREGNQEK